MNLGIHLIGIACAAGAAWFGYRIVRFPERVVKFFYGDIGAAFGEKPLMSLHAVRRCGWLCVFVSLFILFEIVLGTVIPGSRAEWRSTIETATIFLAVPVWKWVARRFNRRI